MTIIFEQAHNYSGKYNLKPLISLNNKPFPPVLETFSSHAEYTAMNTRKLLYTAGICSLSFFPGKLFAQVGSSMDSDTLGSRIIVNDNVYKQKIDDLESEVKKTEHNLNEAQRVEKDAKTAVREAKAAVRAEKKAQEARHKADRQAKNAMKAKEVSDDNKY